MDCIFCKIIAGDITAKILKETLRSISFLDAFPLAKGHVLVIPKNHHQKIQDMSTEENTDLFSLVHLMISKVDALTGATLVAVHNGKDAGQEVPHVHVHLVPRSADDSAGTIHSMFDSTLKLSESEIEELYEKLKVDKVV
jgi:histidine triad (HIT) family protein